MTAASLLWPRGKALLVSNPRDTLQFLLCGIWPHRRLPLHVVFSLGVFPGLLCSPLPPSVGIPKHLSPDHFFFSAQYPWEILPTLIFPCADSTKSDAYFQFWSLPRAFPTYWKHFKTSPFPPPVHTHTHTILLDAPLYSLSWWVESTAFILSTGIYRVLQVLAPL